MTVESAIVSAAMTQRFEFVADPVPQTTVPILQFGSSRFLLSRSIQVTVGQEDGLWFIRSEELGIEAFADSRDEAELSFYEDFDALYNHLVVESDDLLTPEARNVKQAFKKLIVSHYMVTTA